MNNYISKIIEINLFFVNSDQYSRIKFEFIKYYEDFISFAKRLNRAFADVFVIKMIKINEFYYNQIVFVQTIQAEFANRYRQFEFNYHVNDEI